MSIIRSHKKSRDGCEGCKRRKIKCDEVHPSCTFCSSRRVKCVYPIRTAKAKSPTGGSPSASTSPGSALSRQLPVPSPTVTQVMPDIGLKMGELKLMHNYSAVLSGQLALNPMVGINETTRVWQGEIPRMAFEHDFLMHAVLCISSHHIQSMITRGNGDALTQSRQTDFYLDTALSGYRTAISNLTPNNIEAVLAASLIMIVLSTRHHVMHVEGDPWVISFLGLHAGMQSLESVLGRERFLASSLYPLLSFGDKLADDPSVMPPILEEMLNSPDHINLTGEQRQTLFQSLHCLGKLYGLLDSVKNPKAQGSFFVKIMASGKFLPANFSQLARQQIPQALVLLAHYLSFLKIPAVHGFLAENIQKDLSSIMNGVGPQWMRYLETPQRIYLMRSPKDIIMQLMLQLPEDRPNPMANTPMSYSPAPSTTGPAPMGGRVEEIIDGDAAGGNDMVISEFQGQYEVPVHPRYNSVYSPESMQTRPSDQSPGGVFSGSSPATSGLQS